MYKNLFLILSICFTCLQALAQEQTVELAKSIPAGENSWDTLNDRSISKDGIRNWSDPTVPIYTYFRLQKKGLIHLGLHLRVPQGTSKLRVSIGDQSKIISVQNKTYKNIQVGSFEVEEGYQKLKIEGLENTGRYIADINEITVKGPATEAGVYYVEDNYHFGRRGPSVHLRYEVPQEEITYFYNEIEVPRGEDVIGSYFMANGFSFGYFGIQVNSEKERRVLFSVWSPYETQNPAEIPEDYKIELLRKGSAVYTGEFGNEGSGGQSYKVFNWKSDTTYKFLLKGKPAGNNKTDFTAWFYAPELGEWELIASFRRPYTNTHLNDLYSFLENFVPSTGNISRMAYYKNQWVYTTEHSWIESTRARFTADATANQQHRLDYAGGVEGKAYFMKNAGFFDETTPVKTDFQRKATGSQPTIDLKNLPLQ